MRQKDYNINNGINNQEKKLHFFFFDIAYKKKR